MKIEIGKEYTQAGFPDTKVKVLAPVTNMPGAFWCECRTDVAYCEKYYENGRPVFQGGKPSKYQLVEKPLKRTVWVNVWKDPLNTLHFGVVHDSKESCIEADSRFSSNQRALGRKKITLVEGEFDE